MGARDFSIRVIYLCLTLLSSKRYQLIKPGDSITILCQADLALSGCQFKEFEFSSFFGLSKGAETRDSSCHQYYGTGLNHGQCGLFIPQTELEDFHKVYVCRVRTSGSNWHYATSVVQAREVPSVIFPVDCGPRTRIVDPESDVVFLYTAADTIDSCSFKWQGQREWVSEGAMLGYTVNTSQLALGICHLTLHDVIDGTSGFVMAEIKAKADWKTRKPINVCVTTLIVKDAPKKPRLKLEDCIDDSEPSCSGGPGRPTPTISWMRGRAVIRHDEDDDADNGKWVWEYERRTVTQNLNKVITRVNDGQKITCTLWHIALYQNGTKDTSMLMPKVVPISNMFLFIIYLLTGIGTGLLAVTITVTILSGVMYLKRAWCFVDLPE